MPRSCSGSAERLESWPAPCDSNELATAQRGTVSVAVVEARICCRMSSSTTPGSPSMDQHPRRRCASTASGTLLGRAIDILQYLEAIAFDDAAHVAAQSVTFRCTSEEEYSRAQVFVRLKQRLTFKFIGARRQCAGRSCKLQRWSAYRGGGSVSNSIYGEENIGRAGAVTARNDRSIGELGLVGGKRHQSIESRDPDVSFDAELRRDAAMLCAQWIPGGPRNRR